MQKGKSEYQFIVQDPQGAEQAILSWLAANSFQQIQEDHSMYYRSGDAMIGYKFFEYTVTGNQISIYAYLGSFKKPRALANGVMGQLQIIPYKNALQPLLELLDSGSLQPKFASKANSQSDTNMQQHGSYRQFKEDSNKRNRILAEISFWASFAILFLAFTGTPVGVLAVIVNYYFAIQGLKSNKKWKAITAIVVSSIATIIVIVKFLISIF